ncbi:hypothetical protein ACJMK2_025489 [Sinanodonta woodiana]|uniref:XPA C-terminal domain-containing protein n=1 Tax=Sinanodonta woodiana TaxID=1069815 RepID=A0ABD3XIM1_SINWO
METAPDIEKRLTAAQRAKIERNRQSALLLRQSRLIVHPYASEEASGWKKNGPPRQIDTGAGFFLEVEDEKEKCKQEIKHPEGPLMVIENLICEDCGKEFLESYLYDKFHYSVCDNCKQNDEAHPLITKTDARNKYILKDADLDKREPPLHFIIRKNPHNSKWGDMKLYLECQVRERALEVWGNEEKIEEEREKREENRGKAKQKKFDKKVKELRIAVRSSLWKKETGPHQHEYGEENYDAESDMYNKTCKICHHTMTYEKM